MEIKGDFSSEHWKTLEHLDWKKIQLDVYFGHGIGKYVQEKSVSCL